MKKIVIENREFNLKDIKQLYPAVIIKTGYKDETTQMSLEWLDSESKGRVEIVNYAIFISMDNQKHSFFYSSREELDYAIWELSKQINS
jgi:hypothetical protein